jgi:hypothetical protein
MIGYYDGHAPVSRLEPPVLKGSQVGGLWPRQGRLIYGISTPDRTSGSATLTLISQALAPEGLATGSPPTLYAEQARPADDSLAGWGLTPVLFVHTNGKGDLYARPYDSAVDTLVAPAIGKMVWQP